MHILVLNLTDVYRDFHPDKKKWNVHPLKEGQLDFILISQFLVQKVQNCDI